MVKLTRGSVFQFSEQQINVSLALLGALLFALSFPSVVNLNGFPSLAYIALIPPLLLINRVSRWWLLSCYGGLYALFSFLLFNFWAAQFNKWGLLVIPLLSIRYMVFLFPLLKLADSLWPRYGFIVKTLLWVSYEFLRTKGFLAFSYGIFAYSQYAYPSLIGIADLGGVFLVSALTIYPSMLLVHWWRVGKRGRREVVVGTLLGVVFFVGALSYGRLSAQRTGSQLPPWRVALIQPGRRSSKDLSALQVRKERFASLLTQSRLTEEKNPHTIIWPETAIVPSVRWHRRYRGNLASYRLVRNLESYLKESNRPHLIGNNDTLLKDGEKRNYNAALYFEGTKIKEIYRKIQLVPFSETFPYEKSLPWIYQYLAELEGDAEVPFYTAGESHTIFESAGRRFGVLICFEDTFSEHSLRLAEKGADFLVNLSSDEWAGTSVEAMQHGVMAVFRAVETRRSVARSTIDGFSVAIDPNGRFLAGLPLKNAGGLVVDLPGPAVKETLYMRWGDWFAHLAWLSSIGFLLGATMTKTLRRGRHGRKNRADSKNL